MFKLDVWQEIFATVKKNKLRSFLTGFAVAWGIFMLMVLLGSGNGLSNGVTSNFSNEAKNSMSIWTRKTSVTYLGLPEGRYFDFDMKDYEDLRDLAGVELLSGRYRLGTRTCSYKSEYGAYGIESCFPDHYIIDGLKIVSGRFVNDIDIQLKRKVVVLGEDVKNTLFAKCDPIGEFVNIGGIPFMIVGVYGQISENSSANECFIPLTTAQILHNANDILHTLTLTTKDMSVVDNVALEQKIRRILSQNHRIHPDDQRAIGIYNSLEDYKQTMGIFTSIKIFIWFIGIGTLIAGMVGVSNIMLISVKERTKEFGIRKAIGASPNSIVGLVLLEAVFVTSLAGCIGLVLGIGVMELANVFMQKYIEVDNDLTLFLNPTVDLRVAISALILLVFVGSLAGYIPAKHAASVKPIDALHNG